MASVSTYLNFPGNTEEAFLFYKSVFNTDFTAPGIRRLGDGPAPEGAPALPDHVKNMVMHVQLPILGGHYLMGTDCPKEMGFTVTFGNNNFICLNPDSKDETRRLFDALKAGGTVQMELEDMFWGAYFGTLTDRFGVLWMFNCMPS